MALWLRAAVRISSERDRDGAARHRTQMPQPAHGARSMSSQHYKHKRQGEKVYLEESQALMEHLLLLFTEVVLVQRENAVPAPAAPVECPPIRRIFCIELLLLQSAQERAVCKIIHGGATPPDVRSTYHWPHSVLGPWHRRYPWANPHRKVQELGERDLPFAPSSPPANGAHCDQEDETGCRNAWIQRVHRGILRDGGC